MLLFFICNNDVYTLVKVIFYFFELNSGKITGVYGFAVILFHSLPTHY